MRRVGDDLRRLSRGGIAEIVIARGPRRAVAPIALPEIRGRIGIGVGLRDAAARRLFVGIARVGRLFVGKAAVVAWAIIVLTRPIGIGVVGPIARILREGRRRHRCCCAGDEESGNPEFARHHFTHALNDRIDVSSQKGKRRKRGRRHRIAPTPPPVALCECYSTTTWAPSFTRSYRSITSALSRRIQPEDTACPIVSGSLVPWIRYIVSPLAL